MKSRTKALTAVVAAAGLFALSHTRQASAAVPWKSPAFGAASAATCSARGSGDGFSLALFLDKGRSDVVVLEVIPTSGGLGLQRDGPGTASAAFGDATLQVAGKVAGLGGVTGRIFQADLPSSALPAWVHELTSAASATVAMTGQPGAPRTLSLQGSSAAVDGVERCIKAQGFAGVPLPFKAASIAPAPQVGGCLSYGDHVTLEGVLVSRKIEGEDGPTTIPEILLAHATCVYRLGFDMFRPDVRAIQITPLDGQPQYAPPAGAFGRPLTVTGTLRGPVGKYDIEPVVIDIRSADAQSR